tara:strand:+ start:7212 stop:8189 length:978 start_codon:yes stop_codon:yes gene_type:complete
MAIRYTLVSTEAEGFPSSADATSNQGFNVPGGALESIIFRFSGTVSNADAFAADFGSLISNLRVVINGSTVFDYRTGYSSGADATCGQFTYFLNSLGEGLAVQDVASTTNIIYYARVPVGRNLQPGVSRVEYTLGTKALENSRTGTGTVEAWMVYNDNYQTRLYVGPATSLTTSGTGQEEFVVRVNSAEPGVISGVLIQNDRDTDGDISELRVTSQSDYSLETDYWRYLGGDLFNGILFGDAGTSGTELQYAQICPGTVFIPTFGLSRSDELRLQITTTAARTVLAQPVLVAAANAQAAPAQTQTQAVRTNTAQAILDRSGAANQ